MKCVALMALGVWVAEKGLNSTLRNSRMRDLLSDWRAVWVCRDVVRLRRWSGSWVKCCSISFSCPDTGDYPFSWCHGFNSDCRCNWAEWALPAGDTVHPWSKCHVLYLSVSWHFCRAVEETTSKVLDLWCDKKEDFRHCPKLSHNGDIKCFFSSPSNETSSILVSFTG